MLVQKQGFTLAILFLSLQLVLAQTKMAPLKPSYCKGPGSLQYETRRTGSGIVFRAYEDSTRKKQLFESVVLPATTTLNFKVTSSPLIACDRSGSAFSGRIYVCWSDVKNGERNEDIFMSLSEDGGKNWLEPILLTYYPNHKKQNKPSLHVDQASGRVYVLFYDARNSHDGSQFDAAMVVSSDGGLKFDQYFLSEKPFSGDMNDPFFSTKDGKLCAHWIEPDKDLSERVYCLSDSSGQVLQRRKDWNAFWTDKSFTYKDNMMIPVKVKENLKVTAVITKPLDPTFEKVLFKDKPFAKDNMALIINARKLGLKKGNYVVTLYYRGACRYLWITE